MDISVHFLKCWKFRKYFTNFSKQCCSPVKTVMLKLVLIVWLYIINHVPNVMQHLLLIVISVRLIIQAKEKETPIFKYGSRRRKYYRCHAQWRWLREGYENSANCNRIDGDGHKHYCRSCISERQETQKENTKYLHHKPGRSLFHANSAFSSRE